MGNGGFSPPCPGFRRSAFYIAEKWYVKNYTKPVLIEGGHAFGKTTLLKQMLAALLERGVPPGNILYLSFDYPLTRNKSAAEIIEIYRRESCSGSPLFCLLDNVEYASEFVDFCKTAGGERTCTCSPLHPRILTGLTEPVLSSAIFPCQE